MAKVDYSKRPILRFIQFAARELSIGRRQERIIWLADAAADIKTERCDWLRVKPASADWLSTSIKGTDNGGTSVACPATQGNGRRPRKLRKWKEMNGTEDKLWKWEVWGFKVETSKLKLRKLRTSRSANLKVETVRKWEVWKLNLQIWNFKVKTSKLKLRKWVRVFKLETANCDLRFESSNWYTAI